MQTVSTLLRVLRAHDPELPLVFATRKGEVQPGYHITELRHSVSTGIDCGGAIETVEESRLQLLDGRGGSHMKLGTFCAVLGKSAAAVPALEDAPLMVEFGHANSELVLMSAGTPEQQDGRILLPLGDARAVCRPVEAQVRDEEGKTEQAGCC